jgi:hypothetical protein
MNAARILLCLSCPLALSGCIILPIPHRRVHAFGIQGRVVDVSSKKPIAAATIRGAEPFPGVCSSDASGRFSLPPVYGWHSAVMLSPAIGYSMFPLLDAMNYRRAFTISGPAHETKSWSMDGGRRVVIEDYIQVGDLPLAPSKK